MGSTAFDPSLEKNISDVYDAADSWISSFCQVLDVPRTDYLCDKLYKKMGQEMLLNRFSKSVNHVASLLEAFRAMKVEREAMKVERINSQKRVIELQLQSVAVRSVAYRTNCLSVKRTRLNVLATALQHQYRTQSSLKCSLTVLQYMLKFRRLLLQLSKQSL